MNNTVRTLLFGALISLVGIGVAFAGGQGEEGGPRSLRLSMGGSTTMEPIMSSAMEVYRTEVDGAAELSYDAQGSTMGIQGVLNGIFDLGGASRALVPSEREQGVEAVSIAIDGLAIIVNESVPIDDISMRDLAGIFVGEIRNWRQLGGPDQEIVMVNRDEASGTLGAFRFIVLEPVYGDDARFRRDALVTESDGNMTTMVTQTPWSIGYASMRSIDRVRQSGGKVLTVDGIENTFDTVLVGRYPITRSLNLVTFGEPRANAATFIEFLRSKRGQQIIQEVGFLPIR
jgi:phosphate transport system substrate-binding protein